MTRLLALLCTVALAGAVVGTWACTSHDGDNPSTQLPQAEDQIDQGLMIALAQAKNFHHKAKVYMSDGKPLEAIASVRQILSLHFPDGAPEAEDVRLDARALLAKLLLSQGQVDEAMTTVDEGLAQTSRKSFFVANLWTVKGEIHDARADAAKDPAVLKDEKHKAIEAFDKSNQILKVLQDKLLENR